MVSELIFEEDPENSVILIRLDSLSHGKWRRFRDVIAQMDDQCGPIKRTRLQGILKTMSAGQGPQRQWVYSVPYQPTSEHKAALARNLEATKNLDQEKDLERAKNLELAGRFEEAALEYERLGMFEKAGMARREARVQYVISTNFQIGKNGVISIACPHCGGSQPIESKTGEMTCKYCGKEYVIPRKILDMI